MMMRSLSEALWEFEVVWMVNGWVAWLVCDADVPVDAFEVCTVDIVRSCCHGTSNGR